MYHVNANEADLRPDMVLNSTYTLPDLIFGGEGAEDHYSDESQRPRHHKVKSTSTLKIDKHITVDTQNQKGPVFEPWSSRQFLNNEWEFYLPLRREEVGYNDFIAVFERMANDFIEAFLGMVADARSYIEGQSISMEFTPRQVIADKLANASTSGKRLVDLEVDENNKREGEEE